MVYYILKDNHKTGPFTLEELRDLKITKKTYVWYEGLFGWTKAEEILELTEIAKDQVNSGKNAGSRFFTELNLSGAANFASVLHLNDSHVLRDIILPALLIVLLCAVVVVACSVY